MCKPLCMAPVNSANNLGYPPLEIGFKKFAIMRARFEDVPERTAFGIIHHKVQMSWRLECAEKMRCPSGLCFQCLQQDIAFKLREALLHSGQ